MATRIGINGFGRIGRLSLRAILQYHRGELEVAAVNDLADSKSNAHLFKWDSNYGRWPGMVEARDNNLIIDGKEIRCYSERDPAKIGWRENGVEIVIESTGLFTDAKKAAAHREGGAKKILISAPARNEDATIVLGVNENHYDPRKHDIISNASCTTNGVANADTGTIASTTTDKLASDWRDYRWGSSGGTVRVLPAEKEGNLGARLA